MVADYTGFNFIQVQDMCYYDYLLCLRDAVIHRCQETEEGRKYLDNCWLMEQTEPDRQAIREQMKG